MPELSPYLSPAGDRHFDGLADKFAGSLYGGLRGELRLALLDRLLPEMLDLQAQPVLEVGGGLGQLAAWLSERGHAVTLTEPAGEMLERAVEHLGDRPVVCHRLALQSLQAALPGPWPLITCHAVLEWLADPRSALATLAGLLAPGGQLSLMVFNRDALRLSNVVKGNLQKALADRLEGQGRRRRLTPIAPLTHGQVVAWAEELGLCVARVAGVRVFHDYLRTPPEASADRQALLELEWRYSRVDPHWRLGRYLLYTLIRPEEPAS
ncbi:methyltransferase domain-containing protein [Halomonas maura]|uniref:methyltransferase domain-containing protein n=1 Tax=Halomonas maura TaxID=117606 RepID=UPI0025B40D80|nr:methyltransferase domain-containing protein [Halomonas maura]MDN3556123.1 methyltransferase domain-containing protein [Halomonas maura]